jgi:hypothetical protein
MVANAPAKVDPEGNAGENSIPKSRVDAMIAKAKADAEVRAAAAEERARLESERRKELESRTQDRSAAPAAQEPAKPPPTRAQLRALVDEGHITQEEMDAEIERQIESRVEKRVESKQSVKDRASKIHSEIDLYMERIPELDDSGSDSYKRVRAEFTALRKLDYPNDATTELAALRAVLGPVDKLKIPETGNRDREVDAVTHSGSGGEKGEEKSSGPGPLKGAAPHFVEYWTEGIKAGRYKGWDDPVLVKVMQREVNRK